jgi:integrase/recombinase XerD
VAKARAVWTAERMDPFFDGYAEHLALLGMAPATIDYRLRVADMLGFWCVASGTRLQALDEAIVEEFARGQELPTYAGTTYRSALVPLLAFLRLVGRIPARTPVVPPVAGFVDELLETWFLSMTGERGILPRSATNNVRVGRIFLSCFDNGGPLLLMEAVTAESVTAFILSRRPQISLGMAKHEVSGLRCLLRFLHAEGLAADLVGAVPPVFSHRDSGVPKVLPPEVVESITHAIATRPLTRCRNLAMLALVSQLGLRAQEVVDLKLEDIDWRAGTVKIRGKGGYRDTMPLTEEAGELLADYLEHDTHRGPGERHLFHTMIGTYRPLASSGLQGMVTQASHRAGHGPVGTHAFRHTLASRTLNAGASMEEVSQLLRHRSLSSTAIYAKVDFERLGLVTRPWPGPTSMARAGSAS